MLFDFGKSGLLFFSILWISVYIILLKLFKEETHICISLKWMFEDHNLNLINMGLQCRNNLLLPIMVLVIGLTLLHQSQALPFSRTLSLAQHKIVLSNSQVFEQGKWEEERDEQVTNGRRNIETQDYPGPGANSSHEPGGT